MRATIVLLSLLLVAPVRGDAPYRVADLRTWGDGASSAPQFLGAANGVVFFLVDVAEERRSLWRSDGTDAGTFALADPIRVGTERSFLLLPDALYFTTADQRVWRSDGTIAGTAPIPGFEDVDQLFAGNGGRFFFLRTAGRDLWIRDANGERPLANVRNGYPSWTEGGAWGNGAFVANERGVWRSDGTAAGTTKLVGTGAWNAVVAGNRLFFVADEKGDGLDFWTSDGTAAGTMVVAANVAPAPVTRTGTRVAAVGNRALFLGNGAIIASDGTIAGTRTLRSGANHLVEDVAVLNGVAYFAFNDRAHGLELWRSDGTDAGTTIVSDANLGTAGSSISRIIASATRIYFFNPTDAHPRGLYVTDGTAAGTRLVYGGNPDAGPSGGNLATLGDTAFFVGIDGRHGVEPWISDGTAAGTRLLVNARQESTGSSNPRELFAGSTRMYFLADTETGIAIWSTDGTAVGTTIVARAVRPDFVRILGTIGDTLIYLHNRRVRATNGREDTLVRSFANDPTPATAAPHAIPGRLLFHVGSDLWTTDGTAAGTMLLTSGYRTIEPLTVAGRTWLFNDLLSATDGTVGGTRSVAVMLGPSARSSLIPFRGALYAVSQDAGAGLHIWRFSGTPGDATSVARFFPGATQYGASPRVGFATTANRILLFVGRELWRTDGTEVARVKEFGFESIYRSAALEMVSLGDRVVFAPLETGGGYEPWVSDGSSSGTMLLRDIAPGAGTSDPRGFFVADGIAYFSAFDPEHGRELWQTDGTPAGTRLVADIAPGSQSSDPGAITRFGDVLYFAATTSDSGRELWAYPLTATPAVTIDDARATEREGKIAIPVRLTHASPRERITVDYATEDATAVAPKDYRSTSGTLIFEPGETTKQIVVSIADDATSSPTRAFLVRLQNANVRIERIIGAGIIDDDDRVADIGLTLEPNWYAPNVVVRSAGPDLASNVAVCVAVRDTRRCAGFGTLAAGAQFKHAIADYGFVEVAARQWEPDPNAANDSLTLAAPYGHALVATPAVLRVGQSGTLYLESPVLYAPSSRLASSDPSIVSVDSPAKIDSDFYSTTFTALRPGSVQLTVSGGGSPESVTVYVIGPTEPLRIPPTIEASVTHPLQFGVDAHVTSTLGGVRADGTKPTGILDVLVDGRLLASAPSGTWIRATLPTLLPGSHELSFRYGGDSHFLETTRPWVVTVSRGAPSLRAISENGVLTISVRGVPRFAPTGTVTVAGISHPLHAFASLGQATIGPVPAGARTIEVAYSGDERYEPATLTIPIESPRSRTVRP